MIKGRAKKGKRSGQRKANKTAKKNSSSTKKSGKSERDEKEVRKECSKLIKDGATLLTAAVIEEGKKGQLGPVKYLFEMANIFPQAQDGSETTAKEESLAETLLHRWGIPTEPVVADEYEKEEPPVLASGPAAEQTEEAASTKVEASEAVVEANPDAMVGCE